jgi:hypothetical protein
MKNTTGKDITKLGELWQEEIMNLSDENFILGKNSFPLN